MKRILSILLALALACIPALSMAEGFFGMLGSFANTVQNPYEETIVIEIDIAGYGVITAELYPDVAPITVENFVSLVNAGFYDGLTFHRIIDGFMIQGGDPKGNGTGGSGTNIKGEFTGNGVYNPLNHERGVLSMARSSAPNSASSQFFIMHQESPWLDGQYAAFGRVLTGMEIVDAICANTPVTDSNGTVARENQPVINSIRVLEPVYEPVAE